MTPVITRISHWINRKMSINTPQDVSDIALSIQESAGKVNQYSQAEMLALDLPQGGLVWNTDPDLGGLFFKTPATAVGAGWRQVAL